MAGRRTDMHRLQELVRLHRMELSQRQMARELRMSRRTIVRALSAFRSANLLEGAADALPPRSELDAAMESAHPRAQGRQERSSVEPWLDEIKRLRGKGAKPKAIHDWLRINKDEYKGSLSALKRAYARLEREAGPRAEDVAIPIESAPGQEAQVDFVYVGKIYDPSRGMLRKAWLFVMTLCYSRHQYLDIVFDQKAVTWTALHMRAFAYFGGVPHVIIPDNLKAAVIRTAFGHGNDISLHRGYRALARHYGFRVDPTPPRSPQKKGKVERSGGYAKHNFFKTHTSVDLDTDRKALWRWNDEIAAKRVHSVTRRQPMEAFESDEREALLALPQTPYDIVTYKWAKVHRDAHIQVDRALYSVPWKLIGQRVEVKMETARITVFDQRGLICTHSRTLPGKRQTLESHLPEHRGELRKRSRQYWIDKASLLGADCERLAEAIFDSDDVLYQLRKVQAVVNYLGKHPPIRANAASRRALHYGALSYMAVKNILLKGLDLEPLETMPRAWATNSQYARRPSTTTQQTTEEPHDDTDRTTPCTEAPETLGRASNAGSSNAGSRG